MALGFATVGSASGSNPPPPSTGQAISSIQLPRITITDAGGNTHTVDLGALTAQALTDTDLAASLGVNGGALLGAPLPGWGVDTSGGPQSGNHDIALTSGSAAADVNIVGYDVNAANQTAHSTFDALTGTATTTPLTVQLDLGQHGVDADVQPDTSSSAVSLTVTGLHVDLGDLLSSDVLDALPLSGLVDLVSGLGLPLPAGAGTVVGQLGTITGELANVQDAATQLASAQSALATLLLSLPSTTAAQQTLTDAESQLAADLAALQSAQQQLGVDTTTAQSLTTQLAAANADVTYWTGQVNDLTAQLATLLADPLQAVQAAQVAAQLQSAQTALTAAQATAAALQVQLDQANTDVAADQQLVTTVQQQVAADQAAVTIAQTALDALVAAIVSTNQAVADAQATVDALTTALTGQINGLQNDLAGLPDLTTLRAQLVSTLTAAPLLDVGTLGATISSTATDGSGTGTVTCNVTGASVLGQPIPGGPCADLVSRFTDITTALSGALAQLPLGQPVAPALGGLAQSTTVTNPTPTDTDTSGSAGLTPLHLDLPAATLAALSDPAVSDLAAALAPTQLALAGLGMPAATSALTGSLGTLGTTVAALPSGAGLAGLHTLGIDISLFGLATSAVHHRSLPATPPGGAGSTSGSGGGSSGGGVGGGGGMATGGGTDNGGTVANPADPGEPHHPTPPPAGVPPQRTTTHSPLPSLPFTGDDIAVDLAAGLSLLLAGAQLLVFGRSRRIRSRGG